LRPYANKTLAEIARMQNKDPRDAMFDIILAGDGFVLSLITSEKDIRTAIAQPWVAFGTDGPTVARDGPLSKGLVHPRAYGTFPRIFAQYVRNGGLLRLEDVVRRATSLPAERLNIRDRGLLREGYYADVVIFDPATISDTATYENPSQISRGIAYVLVNGQIVCVDGKVTAARPGMVVRGPGFESAKAGP
jgi:N-acyl-D-aspartate/D-glutamate deacylase